ncbi:TPA: phage major capsid protein [Staphylococcus aureus]|nr:phage major capsid protein [Staphylococcus aureus]HCV6212964.1 phage major capsid protein [Staphylococcus aureus]HCV6611438.1 phage major capsid protein [Staphylococcus aureus]
MTTPTYTPGNVILSDFKNGVIPAEQGTLIMKDIMANSAIMKLAKNEPMTAQKKKFTYLAKGVGAYWVSETERIQTSKPEYAQAEMEAKKIGVIIPLSKEFLKWTAKNFFNEVKPLIAEAFYKAFDQAVIFGTKSPYNTSTSGKPLVEGAEEKGNVVTDTNNLYVDLSALMATIEDEELDPNGVLTTRSFRSKMRNALDANDRPLFDANGNEIMGLPLSYTGADVYDKKKSLALMGDWDYARYGILQGIEYAISEDATLTTLQASDASGQPVSLFERDMFALRATMHIAYMNVKPEAFATLKPTE